jgi:LPS sulfotransferase NodH
MARADAPPRRADRGQPRYAPVWWRAPYSGYLGFVSRFGWRGAEVDERTLLARARKETRLDDFGDEEFVEPLRLLIREFDANAGADRLGRQVYGQMLLSGLRNRLRLTDAARRFPEVARQRIEAPLFIVGMPRTGSTLLQGLLAALPGMRTPLHFETDVGAALPWLATPRERRAQVRFAESQVGFVDRLAPGLRVAHDFGARLPEECNPLLMTSFRALFHALVFDCPNYVDHVYGTDFRHAYDWHRLHLQALACRAPGARWVLKGPVHLASLAALLRAYPDACVVFTHRDPLESVPSMAALVAWMRMLVTPQCDRRSLGDGTVSSLARMLAAAETARAQWPASAPRFIDVAYRDLVADPLATVRRILAHFAIALPPDAAAAVQRYIGDHPQHRHGAHRYGLAEFGLDAETVRAVFSREIERAARREL